MFSVLTYDETFKSPILNASRISVTKQYRTANLDFKEYEQAILTLIMLHHHYPQQHYISPHMGHFVPILHSRLLYQDVFDPPGCCAV